MLLFLAYFIFSPELVCMDESLTLESIHRADIRYLAPQTAASPVYTAEEPLYYAANIDAEGAVQKIFGDFS